MEKFREAGSRGGKTTALKHGAEFYAKISAKGAEARRAKAEQRKINPQLQPGD